MSEQDPALQAILDDMRHMSLQELVKYRDNPQYYDSAAGDVINDRIKYLGSEDLRINNAGKAAALIAEVKGMGLGVSPVKLVIPFELNADSRDTLTEAMAVKILSKAGHTNAPALRDLLVKHDYITTEQAQALPKELFVEPPSGPKRERKKKHESGWSSGELAFGNVKGPRFNDGFGDIEL